jgi:hypothetical protein
MHSPRRLLSDNPAIKRCFGAEAGKNAHDPGDILRDFTWQSCAKIGHQFRMPYIRSHLIRI